MKFRIEDPTFGLRRTQPGGAKPQLKDDKIEPLELISLLNVDGAEVDVVCPGGVVQFSSVLDRNLAEDELKWTTVYPDVAHGELERAFNVCLEGKQVRLRLTREHPETGASGLWEVCLSPVPGGEGSVAAALVLARDLTANMPLQPK